MPVRGASPKRQRQYTHIKRSALSKGRSLRVAKRIAAATVNKTKRKMGEAIRSIGKRRSKKAKHTIKEYWYWGEKLNASLRGCR